MWSLRSPTGEGVALGLHHASHAPHTWVHRHSGSILLLVGDDTLGREEHTSDRSSVLEGDTSDLSRVNNPRCIEVLEAVRTSIVAEVSLTLLHTLYDDGTFLTSVGNDLTEGLLDSTTNDLDTGRLIIILTREAI